jgi:hypothetical protein
MEGFDAPQEKLENKALMRRFIEEVWNRGDLDVADELFDPQATKPGTPQLPAGPEGAKVIARMFKSAIPDFHMTIEDLITEDSSGALPKVARTKGNSWAPRRPAGRIWLTGWTIGLDIALANFTQGIATALSDGTSSEENVVETADSVRALHSHADHQSTGKSNPVPINKQEPPSDATIRPDSVLLGRQPDLPQTPTRVALAG